MRFCRQRRYSMRSLYSLLRKQGDFFLGSSVKIEFLRDSCPLPPFLGITVSKKQGLANKRNRFKRLIREAFYLQRSRFPAGLLINIYARKSLNQLTFQDISKDFTTFFSHIHETQSQRTTKESSLRD